MDFHFNDFAKAFLSILFTGMPFLLFGTLFAGFVEAFVPSRIIKKALPKNPVAAVAVSGAMGMVLPMCECGVVAVLRRLVHKGLPVPCAIAYMFASPIVNPIVILSTYTAFTNQEPLSMVLARIGMGYVIAVIVGWTLLKTPVERIFTRSLLVTPRASLFKGGFTQNAEAALENAGWYARTRHALHCAAVDFVDVSVFLVLGAAVAALFNTSVPQAAFGVFATDKFMAVNVMIGLSVILCLCSSSDAFVAAILDTFPPVSKLAMLVFGPMFDLKLLFLYLSAFRPMFVLKTVGLIYLLTLAGCFVLQMAGWFP
ncbi:permease [Kamptonema cortianum]|nr:permease [Oscillatoria laete-virens]MDK3156462.1 permease [Kamptonema cortianum]MDL5053854.1 permease [Oscillatoria laete-virens NRMC-F 0139]